MTRSGDTIVPFFDTFLSDGIGCVPTAGIIRPLYDAVSCIYGEYTSNTIRGAIA